MPKCNTDSGKHDWGKWERCYKDKGDTLAEQASQSTYNRRKCKECGWIERIY